MAGTISDWIIELEKAGLKNLAKKLHSEKLTDYKRLKESGLPIFYDFEVPYINFNDKNIELLLFLSKFPEFVIRAIPKTKDLPRRYKIGVKTFGDCVSFLDSVVDQNNKEIYSVLITDYEPSKFGGVIISRKNDLIIEIGENCNVDDLAHGKITPVGGIYKEHSFNHFKSMKYNTENETHRKLMWRVLDFLRNEVVSDSEINTGIEFTLGYFEFVITVSDKVKFLDYKLNEMYLK